MSVSIAKRYAQALFDVSCDHNAGNLVLNDLNMLSKLMDESKNFDSFVNNPVIPFDKRQVILESILKSRIHRLTYQFISLINQRDRLGHLRDICKIFQSLNDDHKSIRRVQISANTQLDSRQINTIKNHFKKRLNKNIEPIVRIDPHMLGGIKLQDGGTVYDYSLKTQLEQFRKNLIQA